MLICVLFLQHMGEELRQRHVEEMKADMLAHKSTLESAKDQLESKTHVMEMTMKAEMLAHKNALGVHHRSAVQENG